ncbi:hypothetical protein [Streptomyces canus]|uniref:hypothetical protein n=1 Tax=Streptomyces canus TaxID=58343 RepID=UPI003CF4E55C
MSPPTLAFGSPLLGSTAVHLATHGRCPVWCAVGRTRGPVERLREEEQRSLE